MSVAKEGLTVMILKGLVYFGENSSDTGVLFSQVFLGALLELAGRL